MKYKKKTLKNGMRVIAVPMKDTNTVTVMAMVEVGSKYEDKDNNGLSHFLEHMMFKGTEKRPSAMHINKELDGLGAESNAFTNLEYTGYWAKSQAKHFPKLLDIISDMYLDPLFPEEEMEKEKGVIIQEIKMYEDLPRQQVGMLFMKLLYGDQPAGWSILGPEENIRKMKREDFVNYAKKHYLAEKTFLIVAGKCEPEKVFKEAEKAFRNIKRGKKVGKVKVQEKQTAPQLLVKEKKTDQNHLILGFRSYKVSDRRTVAQYVMAGVLGKGMSSRLFHKLREEMGVCYYVGATTDEHTDHGSFEIFSGVETKRTTEVVKVLLEECQRLKTELVSEEELNKTKEYLIGHLFLGLETSDAIADHYASQEIMLQKLKTPEEMKKEIEAVTAKDLQKIAKDIFQNKNLNLAILGMVEDKAKLKKALKI